MTCVMCGKVWSGRRETCPSLCRSRHRENLRLERQITAHYRRRWTGPWAQHQEAPCTR